MTRSLLAALTALLLAGAAPAAAQLPAVLGPGDAPDVATDAVGTGHAVWQFRDIPAGGTDHVRYCRLPAGGSGCSTPPVDLRTPPDTPEDGINWTISRGGVHAFVRPQDGAIIVLGTVIEGLVTWVSTDGGATFGRAQLVGPDVGNADSAALSPDGQRILVGFGPLEDGITIVPVTGGRETRRAVLTDGRYDRDGSVAWLPDGRPVFALSGGAPRRTGFRIAGGDPFDPGAWSAFAGGFTGGGILEASAQGAWLLTTGGAPAYRLRVRRFDAGRFVRPATVGALAGDPGDAGRRDPVFQEGFDADPAGRLHVVGVGGEALCGTRPCVAYRRSEPRGFGPPVPYFLGGPGANGAPQGLSVSANEGGSGWLVFDGVATGQVRAYPLVTPPRGSRVGSRVIGRRTRITLPAQPGCVPVGGRFTHRLDVTGRRDVRVRSVRFFFDDGTPARTDRRAPFRQAFTLRFPAGSRHVASATVTYGFRGRTRRATIGRAIVMCP